jgi:hypothetical protein
MFCVLAVTVFVAVDVVICVNLEHAISVWFVVDPPPLVSAPCVFFAAVTCGPSLSALFFWFFGTSARFYRVRFSLSPFPFRFVFVQASQGDSPPVGAATVAEPPKLYSPHTPVIVLKTSDCCTWEPDNLGSLSGVPREPQIIHILQLIHDQHRVTTKLQQLVQK